MMTPKDPETLTYFSFVEPWGYEDSQNYFTSLGDKIEKSARMSDEIYFHRELLGYSKEMRYMELITITGKNENTKKREDKIECPGCFPAFTEGSEESKLFSSQRCFMNGRRWREPTRRTSCRSSRTSQGCASSSTSTIAIVERGRPVWPAEAPSG